VKQHLAEGADENAENIFDETSLHRASLGRYKEVTELLITKGADVNVQDINGSTLLD
jgi:ankyrin repeat protein